MVIALVEQQRTTDIFGIVRYDTDAIEVRWSCVCNGLGVFAKRRIKKGEMITEYEGRECMREEIEKMADWEKTHVRVIAYRRSYTDGLRLPEPGRGVGSLINSGRNDNAKFKKKRNKEKIVIEATRDIGIDEEILIDYKWKLK